MCSASALSKLIRSSERYSVVLSVVTGVTALVNQPMAAADREARVVLRSQLDAICKESERASALTQRIQLRGRLLPGERQFLFVRDGNKGRFELEHDQTTGRVKCFRLDDGQTFFKLDEQALSLDSRVDHVKKWRSLCNELSLFEAPLFEGQQLDVHGWCDWMRKILDGDPSVAELSELERTGVLSIRAHESSRVIQFSIESTSHPRNPLFVLRVGRDMGAALVGWERHDGADDPAQWVYDLVVENSFSEVVPGIWLLKTGRMRIFDSGTAAKKSGRQETVEQSVEIDSAEVGDFAVEDDFFSPHSLPIKQGTHVQDYRVEPTAYFTYGGGPIDTELLNRAIPGNREVQKSKTSGWIPVVVVNLLALAAVTIAFLLRRKVRHG